MDNFRRQRRRFYHRDEDERVDTAATGGYTAPPYPSAANDLSYEGYGKGGRAETVVKMGPCGGDGGGERDMDATGVTRIAKVAVRHGATVDAVSFLYERNGNLEWTPQWGGGGGGFNEINLAPNEYLISINGCYGSYKKNFVVRSLTFVSNLYTYGPYGRQEGIAFTLPAVYGKIVGFHARSGLYLDAIGTYVKNG